MDSEIIENHSRINQKTLLAISPNAKYAVTFSQSDHLISVYNIRRSLSNPDCELVLKPYSNQIIKLEVSEFRQKRNFY